MPILMIGMEIYWLVTNLCWSKLALSILRIGMYVLLTLAIINYTDIGGTVSARGVKTTLENYGQVIKYFNDKNYKIFLSPVSQIGMIVLPNDSMYQRFEVWGLARTFRRAVIPAYVCFVLLLLFLKTNRLEWI